SWVFGLRAHGRARSRKGRQAKRPMSSWLRAGGLRPPLMSFRWRLRNRRRGRDRRARKLVLPCASPAAIPASAARNRRWATGETGRAGWRRDRPGLSVIRRRVSRVRACSDGLLIRWNHEAGGAAGALLRVDRVLQQNDGRDLIDN